MVHYFGQEAPWWWWFCTDILDATSGQTHHLTLHGGTLCGGILCGGTLCGGTLCVKLYYIVVKHMVLRSVLPYVCVHNIAGRQLLLRANAAQRRFGGKYPGYAPQPTILLLNIKDFHHQSPSLPLLLVHKFATKIVTGIAFNKLLHSLILGISS